MRTFLSREMRVEGDYHRRNNLLRIEGLLWRIDKRAFLANGLGMLRRDCFLRITEQIVQMLLGIRENIDAGDYDAAGEGLDTAFKELLGKSPEELCRMSDTELLAQLVKDGPTLAVPQKTRMLVALLQQAGLVHAAEDREQEAHTCWLKALNLLLGLQREDVDSELGQFIPTIDLLRDQLSDALLPLTTLAALWRHYEHIGAYARAEDALFALLEAEPFNDALTREAKSFYERLLRLDDETLVAGNLPREEISAALAALPKRGVN